MGTVTENRISFLRALNENPHGYYQIFTSELSDGKGGRCALGVGADGLGIPVENEGDWYDAYDLLKGALSVASFSYIWFMNDVDKRSFSDIADYLADDWDLHDWDLHDKLLEL